ncbi:helix-turn-helix domain-containing protein [Candidatus Sulfidibacterium hydrothermale]|uniref:helix-turn-helix domain-containing protein n=1 Tax=Candidatus Sulfidibacterium hydrothermale TaxID=2875962 RepID=UPI001F0A6A35|nr:helix-turn-helix domain-containing protein [Candidatus Sulfidibacterium hydrothermale]UBM62784.1 helix-turn-helix domain-containing protein [Candidatus Sulfidibacterium hydrothermale]
MDIIKIETDVFEEIHKNLQDIKERLNEMKLQNIEDTWLSSKQVQRILGISQKTWQTYRDKRLIRFSQVGQKIYVKAAWLEEFLEKHSINK